MSIKQMDVGNVEMRYRVVSPVLAGQYLQDEIITADQAGANLPRWVARGAVRELRAEESDAVPGVTIHTFVLDATPDAFAAWFAATATSPRLVPAFYQAHLGRYEFPLRDGLLTVRDVDTAAVLTPGGYYQVAIHRVYVGVSTISGAELQAAEGIAFRMIARGDRELKLQARCDILALQPYFQALVDSLLIRWPDAEMEEPGVEHSGLNLSTPQPMLGGAAVISDRIGNAQTGSGTQWNVGGAAAAHDLIIGSHIDQYFYGTSASESGLTSSAGPSPATGGPLASDPPLASLPDSPANQDVWLVDATEEYRHLYGTLVACGLSGDPEQIEKVSADARLAPWRETLLALPEEVAQRSDRVHAAIARLYDGTHPTTGRNGLVLLLQVLSDQHSMDPCGAELQQRIQEITARLEAKPPWWDVHRLFRYSWDGVNEEVTRRQRQIYLLVAGGTVLASLIALGFLQAGEMIPELKQDLGLPAGALPTVLGFCIRSFFLALIGFMFLGLIVVKWMDRQVIFSVARNLSLLGLVYLGCAAVPLSPMLLPTWAVPILLLPLTVLALWWIFFQSMLGFYWRKGAYGDLALEALVALGCFGLLWYPIERLIWQPLVSFINGGIG